jgi:predicted SAM-dependent methyltransferase
MAMSLIRKLKDVLRPWKEKIRVKWQVRRHSGDLRIIIGAASTRQEGWISTNYPALDLTDERTFSALFERNTVRTYFAEHVWEHLTSDQAIEACHNCFLFLASGGRLRIAVPDGFHPSQGYIEQVKPGGSGPGADVHKVLYNFKTLSSLLEKAGFEVRLLEWFDEENNFHYQDWDVQEGWVRRSSRFDQRNQENRLTYTSLIIDAMKPWPHGGEGMVKP